MAGEETTAASQIGRGTPVNVEIRVWTLIGVVIAGGGVATSLLLHAVGSLGGRLDSLERRIGSLERRFHGLANRTDALETGWTA